MFSLLQIDLLRIRNSLQHKKIVHLYSYHQWNKKDYTRLRLCGIISVISSKTQQSQQKMQDNFTNEDIAHCLNNKAKNTLIEPNKSAG